MDLNQANGYSATPLLKKLGIKPGLQLVLIDAPEGYREALTIQQLQLYQDDVLHCQNSANQHTDWVQLFVRDAAFLANQLRLLRNTLKPDAVIWVSWPKKAARQPTDISEDTIRQLALPLGLVDIKVCAVDATWSGLKLMLRRELR